MAIACSFPVPRQLSNCCLHCFHSAVNILGTIFYELLFSYRAPARATSGLQGTARVARSVGRINERSTAQTPARGRKCAPPALD
jgi:hypothetical protein